MPPAREKTTIASAQDKARQDKAKWGRAEAEAGDSANLRRRLDPVPTNRQEAELSDIDTRNSWLKSTSTQIFANALEIEM